MKLQSIKRYEAYKDSGVEWLGDVPAHWDILRVKDTVIKIGNGVTPKGGSEVYTDTGIPFLRSQNVYDDGLRIANVSFISKEIYDCMKGSQLKAGDILINITGASIGRTCVVPLELGAANINQHIAFLRTKFWFNIGYISLCLKSPFTKNYIQFEQNGASKEAFNLNQIANIPLILPKHAEQQSIAVYLDTKTAQIDRKIELLSQKAVQYGKLKQSLINETVTRGLDKSVPMKDSGVEWVGEVPAHWDVKRVKEISTVFNGATPKSSVAENWGGELPWVTTDDLGKLNTKFITDTKRKITAKGYASCGTTVCPIGSIVISGRAPIGHIGILSIKASSNQGCKTLVLSYKGANNVFIFYSLLSSKPKLEALGRGTTFIELSTKELGLFNLPMPPLPEQQAIANYLDEKTAHIDRIVSTINSQIDKLKELRLTLINDVVTGKIKVA
jgi:type I restriction enzyme S subunit